MSLSNEIFYVRKAAAAAATAVVLADRRLKFDQHARLTFSSERADMIQKLRCKGQLFTLSNLKQAQQMLYLNTEKDINLFEIFNQI